MNYLTLVFPILLVAALLWLFIHYFISIRQSDRELCLQPGPPKEYRSSRSFFGRSYPLGRRDFLPIIIITLIYALIAFYGLGSHDAPESFLRFEDKEPAVIDMGEPKYVTGLMYYTGIFTGSYTAETSIDGEHWQKYYPMEQSYAEIFQWVYAEPEEGKAAEVYVAARYIRLKPSKTPIDLGEIALYDLDDNLIDSADFSFSGGAEKLFDEQDIIPENPSYMDRSYFDEVYHARTAYEHLTGVDPYEVSHPPLGKLIISVGIAIFGLNPFGWRFMGTLFGVLMVPLIYVFVKNIFGKRKIAIFGTLLFAFDFMHYTQTRIATIDTYGVFFTILMYLFMYRYVTLDYDTPFRKTLVPLGLSGLFFGIGLASKWTCAFAGAGLALIYVVYLILRGRYMIKQGKGREYWGFLASTLLYSLLVFIAVPAVIYTLSYLPYATGDTPFSLDIVLENQKFMFTYHNGVTAEHPYASRWWMWVFDIRPILYYLNHVSDTMRSSFAAFGNPVLYWGGLLALVAVCVRFYKRRDGRAVFIIIGYIAQLLPWVIIQRPAFAYHYFPCAIFLTLALCCVMDEIDTFRLPGHKYMIWGTAGAALLLFAAFYPVLSGVPVLREYSLNFLKWFPSWPF